MARIIISGYYGFSNAGDEAILWSLIEQIRKAALDTEITVLSAQPEKTAFDYNVRAAKRNNFIEIIKLFKNSDIFIDGGGSLLQDVTSSKSLYYYLILTDLAKRMGLITALYSNGIGPINSPFNRYLTKRVLEKTDFLSVRDEDSRAFLKNMGIRKKDIFLTVDPALILEPALEERGKEILESEGIDIENINSIVGISVRPWVQNYREVFAKFSDFISRELESDILFIPFHGEDDIEESLKIIKLMDERAHIIKGSYNPKELMSIIKRLNLLVGVRLHSLIFAAAVGTPFCGLSYDPKIDGFLKMFEMEPIGYMENMDLDVMCSRVKGLWVNRESISSNINEKVINLSANIKQHNRQFFNFLGI